MEESARSVKESVQGGAPSRPRTKQETSVAAHKNLQGKRGILFKPETSVFIPDQSAHHFLTL